MSDPAPSLDEAWKECEAALLEGWRLSQLLNTGNEWRADAEPRPAYRSWENGTEWLGVAMRGPTPAAALQALATRLRRLLGEAPKP